MEVAEAIRRRRMVRSYDPARQVPRAALDALLEAALRAPSAGFAQGVSLLVLVEPEDRSAFWAAATPNGRESRWVRRMRSAPLLLTVWTSQTAYLERYAEPDKGWTDRDPRRWSAPYWWVDAGMSSMAVLLTAVDNRLGACFFGIPPDGIEPVRQVFGVPSTELSVGVISVGYPAPADPVGSPRRRARRLVSERSFSGRWGSHTSP
jgi:nitroreductase